MATAHTSTSGKSATKRSASASKSKTKTSAKQAAASAARTADGVALLKADHREVEKLFGDFEKAKDEGRKEQIATQICLALRVHTQIEEEIFYPTSRKFLKDDEIVNEAIVEHQSAKELIEQIEDISPSDEMFEAKVTVLKELIEHHVEEEEKEYFPQVQKTDMDLKAIGQQLATRKQQLLDEMGGEASSTH